MEGLNARKVLFYIRSTRGRMTDSMSGPGQSLHFRDVRPESALPPEADIV